MARSHGLVGRRKHVPPLKKRCVSITDEQAALLRKWGRGDLSAGLRWLVDAAANLVLRREDLEGIHLDNQGTGATPKTL